MEGPLHFHVSKESKSQISEHESLHCIPNDLKGHRSDILGLGRQIVPGVMAHKDSASEQSNDAREVKELRKGVGQVAEAEDHIALNNRISCQKSEGFQEKGAKQTHYQSS